MPTLLVATKLDLRNDRVMQMQLADRGIAPVSYEEGFTCMKKIRAANYKECSALTQKGLKDVFDEAIRIALFPETKKTKKSGLRRCMVL